MQSNDIIEVVAPLGGGISEEVTLFPDAAAVHAGTGGALVDLNSDTSASTTFTVEPAGAAPLIYASAATVPSRSQGSCPHPPVGLRHDGNNRNASQGPAHLAWPTHPHAAIRGATSFSCPRSSFAGKPRGTGGLVPVVGRRPARVLRQSRRARSFLGNVRAIFELRSQGKCVRTSMDDTFSRHGSDGAGAPIWRYAGTWTRAAVGGFRQRGPALPIRFSHGDLVWDQVPIRLLRIRCHVLRPIPGSRRLESMDRRLFTMMLHEVEKCAISYTQRLLQPGLARAWLRRTPRGLSVCLYGAADDALCAEALIVSSLRECNMTTGTVSSAGTLAGWFVMVTTSADFQETSFGATAGVGLGSTQLIRRRLHLPITRRTVSPLTCRRDSQTGSTLTAIRSWPDKRGMASMMCHLSSRCLAPSSSESEVTSTTGKALFHLRFRKLPMATGMRCRTGFPTLEHFHQRDK